MKKKYVLDTNILMTAPNIVTSLEDNDVYISTTVIEELDNHKNDSGERGYNAREAIRQLKEASFNFLGNYREGVNLSSGGTLYVFNSSNLSTSCIKEDFDNKLSSFSIEDELSKKPDNRILFDAYCLKEVTGDATPVILITNDTIMQIKADIVGITVQDYKNSEVMTKELYTGYVEVDDVDPKILKSLKDNKTISASIVDKELYPNEFVVLSSEFEKVLAWKKGDELLFIETNNGRKYPFGITPGKIKQKFAFEALLAPAEEIPLVIIKGPAGTGKTFLSLAAGLDGVYDEKEGTYDKLLITRTNCLSDDELGFLPGDLDDKMTPLLKPFFDNLEAMIRQKGETREMAKTFIEDLFYSGTIEMESVAYMRGRSLSHTYLIVDEAQNATPNQILEIVTRAGKGTKVVLLGDIDQIDNPKLSKRNNGLVFASEKMKGSSLVAQLEFSHEDAVRSPLSIDAAKRLTI